MNGGLQEFLDRCIPVAADAVMLDTLRNAMEAAVPEIAEKIALRQREAARLRVSPYFGTSHGTCSIVRQTLMPLCPPPQAVGS